MENTATIFLNDFGLSSRYEKNQSVKVSGNLKFMATDVLYGKNPSPKTELESFIYLLASLLAKLPWKC